MYMFDLGSLESSTSDAKSLSALFIACICSIHYKKYLVKVTSQSDYSSFKVH